MTNWTVSWTLLIRILWKGSYTLPSIKGWRGLIYFRCFRLSAVALRSPASGVKGSVEEIISESSPTASTANAAVFPATPETPTRPSREKRAAKRYCRCLLVWRFLKYQCLDTGSRRHCLSLHLKRWRIRVSGRLPSQGPPRSTECSSDSYPNFIPTV
jgi:hypothetical protein